MKYKFTLLHFLLLLVAGAEAQKQNITGIWKGYFIQNSFGFSEDRYKFEIQVEQLPNNALNGVTYSYKTTVFYGKAEAKGIYTQETKNFLLNELKLVDLKIDDKSQPCLMTCYLEYDKIGDIETLTGTYSSRNMNDKSDCGNGKVYLEKSTTSDFYKEDFLVKRENELKKKQSNKKPNVPKTSLQNRATAKVSAPKKGAIKPGAEDNLIAKSTAPATAPKTSLQNKATAKVNAPKKSSKDTLFAKKSITKPAPPVSAPATPIIPKKDDVAKAPAPPPLKILPTPDVIKNRDNELVKTIITSAKEFTIDLYDNGEVDGDRITVYHNNEMIVSNRTLTDKPISFTIKADENSPVHEFVMVAENLGTIPPNTALMIITAGGKRYELFVTSTEQKNALVRVEYKPEQ